MSQLLFKGSGGTPATITIDGDVGSASGSTITFNANPTSGSSVLFSAGGTTVDLDLTDASHNTTLGLGSGNISSTGSNNIGLGYHTLNTITSGSGNSAVGSSALDAITTGSYNIAIGYSSGSNYTTSESSNIVINAVSTATIGESNTLRIGDGTGTGNRELNAAFISGIYNISPGGTTKSVIINSTGQLGTVNTGSQSITSVNFSASPYTVQTQDQYISVDCSGGIVIILLPDAATAGRVITIKDSTGNAATTGISISAVSGLTHIDGDLIQTISTNYKAVNIIYNSSSTAYEIF